MLLSVQIVRKKSRFLISVQDRRYYEEFTYSKIALRYLKRNNVQALDVSISSVIFFKDMLFDICCFNLCTNYDSVTLDMTAKLVKPDERRKR